MVIHGLNESRSYLFHLEEVYGDIFAAGEPLQTRRHLRAGEPPSVGFFYPPSNPAIFVAVGFFYPPSNSAIFVAVGFFYPPSSPAIFVKVGFFLPPSNPAIFVVVASDGPQVFCIARQMMPSMT